MLEMKKISGEVVFSGNIPHDADGCAAALHEAGFEVTRMAERFKELMDVEGDEFLEAQKIGSEEAVWIEINAIVGPFGGDCDTCGAVPDDYVPLQFLHDQTPKERA